VLVGSGVGVKVGVGVAGSGVLVGIGVFVGSRVDVLIILVAKAGREHPIKKTHTKNKPRIFFISHSPFS
jgi:hypothetical protein